MGELVPTIPRIPTPDEGVTTVGIHAGAPVMYARNATR